MQNDYLSDINTSLADPVNTQVLLVISGQRFQWVRCVVAGGAGPPGKPGTAAD